MISLPSRRLICEFAAAAGERPRSPESRKACRAFLEQVPLVRLAHQIEHILAERFIARPAEDLLGLRIPVQDRCRCSSIWTKASSAVSMMPRASCSLSRNVSCACRLSVMSRPTKKKRLAGSDHVAEPGQPHLPPVLVDAARVGELRALPAPRRAHFLARVLEMVGMDEVDPAAADHFLRPDSPIWPGSSG